MGLYIINILLLSILGLISKKIKDNDFLLWISFSILVLMSGLRANSVGTDTGGYIHIFNNLSKNFQWDRLFDYSVEPLFAVLNWFSGLLSDSSQSIIIVTSILINLFVVKGIIDHSEDKLFSLFLYIGLYHYYQSFNGIRQYIAISLVFYSYKYIKSRQFNKFILLVLIATGFHVTAVIFIPYYFIYNKIINLKSLILFGILTFMFIGSFNRILELVFIYFPEYQVYESTIGQSSGGIRDVLLSIIFIIFGTIFGDLNSKQHIYLTMIAFTYFAFSVLVLFFNPNLMIRLGWYFSIFMVLYIPNTLSNINEVKLRFTLKYCIYCSVFLLHLYLLSMNFHRVVPYELYITK